MVIYHIFNLDWKPVPIISKFVDILANGISNKDYDINAFAQDPVSVEKEQITLKC